MKIVIKQIEEQPISKIKLFNDIREGKIYANHTQPTVEERINLMAKWQDLKPLDVEKMHISTINNVVDEVIKLVHDYQPSSPLEAIGDLTHRTDYLSFTSGHWKHIETVDYDKSPESFMALFYIEKGLQYSHEEERGGRMVVINPLSDRAKVIKQKATLNVLIDLLSFFLNISHLLNNKSVLILSKKLAKKRRKRKAVLPTI